MRLRQVKFILSAGAEVVCAETVMNPVQLYSADQIPEMEDELKFLFTIRSVHLLNLLINRITIEIIYGYVIKAVSMNSNLDNTYCMWECKSFDPVIIFKQFFSS